ncbi:tRNA (N6-isopentenyl adenosine(37)-C2)-methylthiotransferase MiaB, partial [Shewanella algae]
MKKARMINERLPGVVLTTDIIVGFPGETDEQFMDTMTLLDEVAFENIFAFAYSARPFTKAAKLKDQLSEEEKNER